jgi:hypothetical protein
MYKRFRLPSILAMSAAISLAACSGHSGGQVLPNTDPGFGADRAGVQPLFGDADGIDAKPPATNVAVKLGGVSLSSGAKSVVVTLTKQGTKAVKPAKKTITNFTGAGSIKCTTTKGCTVPGPQAAAGSDTFTVVTFDALKGKGSQLATLTVVAKIKATKTTVNVTLKKIVKTAAVANANGTAGTAKAATALALSVKDADGNVVVGTYNNPVTVADADATTATTLSGGVGSAKSQVFSSSTQSLKLAYSGLAIVSPKITPSGSGIAGTAGTFTVSLGNIAAVIVPTPKTTNQVDLYALSGTGSSATIALTQPGWKGGAFNNAFTTSLAFGSGNCGANSGAAGYKITGSGAAFTTAINATLNSGNGPNAGKCTLTVTGGAGKTLAIVLTWTTTGIGINGKHQ